MIVEVQDESDKNIWQIAFFVFRLFPEKADNLVNRELAKNNKERKNGAEFMTRRGGVDVIGELGSWR